MTSPAPFSAPAGTPLTPSHADFQLEQDMMPPDDLFADDEKENDMQDLLKRDRTAVPKFLLFVRRFRKTPFWVRCQLYALIGAVFLFIPGKRLPCVVIALAHLSRTRHSGPHYRITNGPWRSHTMELGMADWWYSSHHLVCPTLYMPPDCSLLVHLGVSTWSAFGPSFGNPCWLFELAHPCVAS